MKKQILIVSLTLLCFVIFAQNENELLTKFSTEDKIEIDFNRSNTEDSTDVEEGFSFKSSVYSTTTVDRELELRRQIDSYYLERRKISEELRLADDLVKNGNYAELNSRLTHGFFRQIEADSDSIKKGDDLYVTFYGFESMITEDGIKYVYEFYPGWPSLEEEVGKYENLKEQFNIDIQEKTKYKMEIDPWKIYGDDPVKYSEYLLSLISQLLVGNPSLNCTFETYKAYENAQHISTLNNLISFRYSFLNFCYEKIN